MAQKALVKYFFFITTSSYFEDSSGSSTTLISALFSLLLEIILRMWSKDSANDRCYRCRGVCKEIGSSDVLQTVRAVTVALIVEFISPKTNAMSWRETCLCSSSRN